MALRCASAQDTAPCIIGVLGKPWGWWLAVPAPVLHENVQLTQYLWCIQRQHIQALSFPVPPCC